MSTPVLPTIIRGPGIVIHNGYSFYFKEDIKVKINRKVFEVMTDMFGRIGSRMESLMVDIDVTPAGEMESMVKYFPYGPTNLVAASSVGNSIFTASDVPLVIHTKAGLTTTYSRAGIAKSPTLNLSPTKTVFGPMTFSAIGKRATQQTSATWLKAIASAGFTDTGFDQTKLITDIFTATLGSRSSPYNAMGARHGFEIEPVYELDDVPDDGIGIADRLIASIMWWLRFAPNNLTEPQMDALANWSGSADAILPGMSISKGPSGAREDIIIAADSLTATLHAMGVVTSEHGMGVKVDRNGTIEFANEQTFTTGAPDAMITLTVT